MSLRTGHGTGAGVPRVEVLPPDEQPRAVGDIRPDGGKGGRGRDGRFTAGNKASAVPKSALARVVTSEGDPTYRRFSRAAGSWRRQRSSELAALSGGQLGCGPSAHVAAAARGMADACYVRHLAAKETDPKEAASLLATANRIEAQWKQADLAAWEMAQREGAARLAASGHDPIADLGRRLDALTPKATT